MVDGHGPTLLDQIASGAGSVAKLATAIAPMLEMINTEPKYYDETATFSAYNSATNADVRCLTDALAQGTGDSQRIGNSVLAKDLQLRMALSFTSTNGAPHVLGGFLRIMLFVWKFNDAGGPTVAKLLEVPTNAYSPLNKDYTDNFVVIKDKHIAVESPIIPPAAGTATSWFRALKWFKKLDFHIRWSDASATTINSSQIWLMTYFTATAAANAVSTTMYSRLNYTDN